MRRNPESGVALLTAILALAMMTALLVGFIAVVNADQLSSGANRDQSQAYAAAHSGIEKLTTDLGQLFQQNFSPSGPDVQALAVETRQPNLGNGTSYVAPDGSTGYTIEFNDFNNDGNPDQDDPAGTQIQDGAYAGLIGLITPYRMTVTARTTGGSEVRMRRTMQTVAIPVFQFGIFSENDLSFFAGPEFNFGGRVHSNQNVYLASGSTLWLTDRVSAVGEIVRSHLANGTQSDVAVAGSNHNGTVRAAFSSACATTPNATNCRALAISEDSVNLNGSVPPSVPVWHDGVDGAPGWWEMELTAGNTASNPWLGISRTTYNNWVRNGATGARRLDLPIVNDEAGTTPIDLIRRPRAGDPTGAGSPFQERFFRLASLRILLSDTAADITGLPTIDTSAAPVNLAALVAGSGGYSATGAPPALSDGAGGARVAANTPLVSGFIKIERQDQAGAWNDVTMAILNLGIAGRNLSNGTANTPDTNVCLAEPFPDAVIRIQRLRDVPSVGGCGNGSTVASDYQPMTIYDAREGARRTADVPAGASLYMGGVMHYVELDVNNLRRFFNGDTAGGAGASSMDVTGYVVYFSDRRGNRDAANQETGEYGYENVINPASATSADNSTAAPDTGEDINFNGVVDTYGGTARYVGNAAPLNGTPTPRTVVSRDVARQNPAMFFRRALKLVNGGRGMLPANGAQGLTVASENPVYIQGNFNACGTPTQDCAAGTGFGNTPGTDHVSASVVADAVTLLSRTWNDLRSFNSPHSVTGRVGNSTWYRLGIIAGKGINFPRPTSATTTDHQDFGTDGGAHNFLRYLESWAPNTTIYYRGSIISLYTNRQGAGVYKCCGNVYDAPGRGYAFDQDFLDPRLLPPRTPMFRDINTLTFRQVLRPTQ